MAQGHRITPAQRRKVIALLPTGQSCRAIAKQTGVGRSTVSNIAKEAGHVFGKRNIEAAVDANRAYSAERRATQSDSMARVPALAIGYRMPPRASHDAVVGAVVGEASALTPGVWLWGVPLPPGDVTTDPEGGIPPAGG